MVREVLPCFHCDFHLFHVQGIEAYTSQEDPGPSGPADGEVSLFFYVCLIIIYLKYPNSVSSVLFHELWKFYLQRDEDVTALYKRYLRQEITYRQLKMKKLEKEIQLLDKQLDVS